MDQYSNGRSISYVICTGLTIQILDQYIREQDGNTICPVFKWSGCPVFKWHSKSRQFGIPPLVNHLNTGLLRYSDSNCTATISKEFLTSVVCLQVSQVGVSACGATAVLNVLQALDWPHSIEQVTLNYVMPRGREFVLVLRQALQLGYCRDPTVDLEVVIYIVGKRGIFTLSPLPWVFCPLSFYITMSLILFRL